MRYFNVVKTIILKGEQSIMVKELIRIALVNDRPTVLGRDLHEFLEVGTQYSIWFGRMCEYGFVENQDFIAINQKRLTAQGNETTQLNHQLTLEMSKEISMLQRSEKGKTARKYFIECENKLKQYVKSDSYLIDDKIERAKRWIQEQEESNIKVAQLEKEIDYKQKLIDEFNNDTDLASKRQRLNNIIRKAGCRFEDRWSHLYKEFQLIHHFNLTIQFNNYNLNHKPKAKSKLEYIEKTGRINDLYALALKVFENDVNKLIEEMFGVVDARALSVI